jgi:hypothetical protein
MTRRVDRRAAGQTRDLYDRGTRERIGSSIAARPAVAADLSRYSAVCTARAPSRSRARRADARRRDRETSARLVEDVRALRALGMTGWRACVTNRGEAISSMIVPFGVTIAPRAIFERAERGLER